MALQHLPRPWLLAALAEVPMTQLTQEDDDGTSMRRRDEILPRPDPRRRRLSARRAQVGRSARVGRSRSP